MTNESREADRLYQDAELAQFYDLDNGWADDLEYCRGLAEGGRSVLDLGCGTGLFLSCLARDRRLVGVDPAAAMLEIARHRPSREHVTWIEADATAFRTDERFDLVVLTGHAFQVFLTEADQRAVLATIAAHLAPDGRFIFDTREPATQAWRSWKPDNSRRVIAHPELGDVEAWNDAHHDPATGVVSYETHYRVVASGRLFSADSQIAFPRKEQVAALIDDAGLAVDRWLGDWQGDDYAPGSREIIPIGRLR